MIGRTAELLARITPVPLLVRCGVFGAGLAPLLLAAPAELRAAPPVLAGAVVLAALPAILPDGPWATLVMLATAAGWVLATGQTGSPRVLVLAALLYLLHSLAALAAALPYDAVVAPAAAGRWLLRTAAVLVAGTLLAAVVLAGLAGFAGDREHVAATLAGLALAVGLTVLLRTLLAGRAGSERQ